MVIICSETSFSNRIYVYCQSGMRVGAFLSLFLSLSSFINRIAHQQRATKVTCMCMRWSVQFISCIIIWQKPNENIKMDSFSTKLRTRLLIEWRLFFFCFLFETNQEFRPQLRTGFVSSLFLIFHTRSFRIPHENSLIGTHHITEVQMI